MTSATAMTRHASVRQQQRRVPPLVVDWLMDYGQTEYVGHACYRFFDKESRRRLATDVGDRIVGMLAPLLDCYLVVGNDGKVITVGHRYTRICRA